jgi:hypothetical protein
MTPSRPCCAIAIARRDSVTVSIAALTSGTFKRILRVRRVLMSTCLGSTVECRGTSRMSSKVRAVVSVGCSAVPFTWLHNSRNSSTVLMSLMVPQINKRPTKVGLE